MALFVLLLLHVYIGWRLVPAVAAWPWLQALVVATLVASWLLMPMTLLARRIRRRTVGDALALSGAWFMGLFSSLFVLTLLRDLVLGGVTVAAWAWPAARPDRFGADSALAVLVLAFGVTLWGWVNARRIAPVKPVDVPIAGLPDALHGFTIAQISDVHVGPTIKRRHVQAIVERVNAIGADLVAITGDLVDGSVRDLAAQVAPLAALRSRHGTFFVTGNQ